MNQYKKVLQDLFKLRKVIVGILCLILWHSPSTAQQHYIPHTCIDSVQIQKDILVIKKLSDTQLDSAEVVFNALISKYANKQCDKGQILLLAEWSSKQIQMGKYGRAKATLYQVLALDTDKYHPYLLAIIYNNLGNVYSYLNQYDSAVSNYYLALQYKEQFHKHNLQLNPPISYIYNNLGYAHFEMGNFSQTYYYLLKTRQEAISSKDTNLLINNNNNLGGYYFATSNWDSCEYMYKQTIEDTKHFNHQTLRFRAYVGLGTLNDELQRIDSALYYSLLAYNLYQATPLEKHGYNTLLCNIGGLYAQKKDFNSANKFYTLVERDPDITLREQTFLLFRQAEMYADMGDFEKAYELKNKYYVLNDSLKSETIALKINDLSSKYELSQKNRALAESEAQLMTQQLKVQTRNLWLWALSITIFTLIIITLVWQKFERKRQKTEQLILGLKAQIAGEEKEKARIGHDLHDSVNSQLSAIKSFLLASENIYPSLSSLKEYTIAKALLTDTSTEVRNIAHNLAPDKIVHEGFLNTLVQFCEKHFVNTPITLHMNTAGDFATLKGNFALNCYRIIQELCNNITKHAHASVVTILILLEADELSIVVEDDGIGLADDTLATDIGIGIYSVKNRVKMYNGSLQIDTEKNKHTAFYIKFNLANQ